MLRLKYTINELHTAQMPLPNATDNEYDFLPFALQLLDQLWHPGTPVRLVGVGLTRFEEAHESSATPDRGSFGESTSASSPSQVQLTLFDEEVENNLGKSKDSGNAAQNNKTGNPTKASAAKKDRRLLAKTTDSIKDKFGKSAIRYGRDLRFGKQKTTSHEITHKHPEDKT